MTWLPSSCHLMIDPCIFLASTGLSVKLTSESDIVRNNDVQEKKVDCLRMTDLAERNRET